MIVVVTKEQQSLAMKQPRYLVSSCNGIANSMRDVGLRIVLANEA
jgi:hypothetical protein